MPSWDKFECKRLTTTTTSKVIIEDKIYLVDEIYDYETKETRYDIKRHTDGRGAASRTVGPEELEYIINTMNAAEQRTTGAPF